MSNEELRRNDPNTKMLAEEAARVFLLSRHLVLEADTALHELTHLVATGKLQQSAELDAVMSQLADLSPNRLCCMMVAEEIVKQVKETDHGNE